MKIGIPTIKPHTPKKCSEKISTIKVKNTGKSVLEDINFGFSIYASIAWITIIKIITEMTCVIPPTVYPIIHNGIKEIITPATGISPSKKIIIPKPNN